MFQPGKTHTVTGTLNEVHQNGVTFWGLTSDRAITHLFLVGKFRLAEVPENFRIPGYHVQVTYTVQDSIGGDWGIVIQPSAIRYQ
jgi:hypothetical protein